MSRISPIALRHNLLDKGPHGSLGRLRKRLMIRRWGERGLWVMAVVTVLYLFIEFAFSAALIDVMAANDTREIDGAERVGRLLSGFAMALLFWPMVFARTRNWWTSIMWLFAGSGLVILLVYQGERALIKSLVEQSSAESRAAAVTGSLLRKGLASGTIDASMFDGLWAETTVGSVAGKAFVGVVAYMAAGSASALQQTHALAPEVVRRVIEQDIGGLDGEYKRYVESQSMIQERYRNHYLFDLKQFEEEVKKVPMRANQLWEHYLDRLDAQNRDWGRGRIGRSRSGELVPGFAAPKVRAEVRNMGLDVKDSWSTGDKAAFIRLADTKYRAEMRAALVKALDGLPTNLTLEAFSKHPTVQKMWRESLQYPDSVTGLSLTPITRAKFEENYYMPALSGRTYNGLKSYSYQIADYGDEGQRAGEGKKAYEAMIAPVFALTLSLLGALLHSFKALLIIIQLHSGWRFKNSFLKAGCLIIATLLMLLLGQATISTRLTSHSTYQSWISADRDYSVLMLDTMIKVQTFAYPIFNGPRSVLQYAKAKVEELK